MGGKKNPAIKRFLMLAQPVYNEAEESVHKILSLDIHIFLTSLVLRGIRALSGSLDSQTRFHIRMNTHRVRDKSSWEVAVWHTSQQGKQNAHYEKAHSVMESKTPFSKRVRHSSCHNSVLSRHTSTPQCTLNDGAA